MCYAHTVCFTGRWPFFRSGSIECDWFLFSIPSRSIAMIEIHRRLIVHVRFLFLHHIFRISIWFGMKFVWLIAWLLGTSVTPIKHKEEEGLSLFCTSFHGETIKHIETAHKSKSKNPCYPYTHPGNLHTKVRAREESASHKFLDNYNASSLLLQEFIAVITPGITRSFQWQCICELERKSILSKGE